MVQKPHFGDLFGHLINILQYQKFQNFKTIAFDIYVCPPSGEGILRFA